MKTGFGLIGLLITIGTIALVSLGMLRSFQNTNKAVHVPEDSSASGEAHTGTTTVIDGAKNVQNLVNKEQENIQKKLGE